MGFFKPYVGYDGGVDECEVIYLSLYQIKADLDVRFLTGVVLVISVCFT